MSEWVNSVLIRDPASVCECVFIVCVHLHLLTVWGDCLYGLALSSDVPYGQSPVWVTANELLALVMPGNWVDRLGNNRQEAKAGGGVSGSAGGNIMCHHLRYTVQVCCVATAIRYTVQCSYGTLDYMLLNRWWKRDKRVWPLTSEHFLWHKSIY